MTTPYHACYYAHELTRRSSSDSVTKLGASLSNATVDLNPHQLDAALFAFRSPISRGAILADEVGLGKTIEAGLVISQLWAERKRRILVIAPTILRKQWAQEMADKFFLPSVVLDGKEYNSRLKSGAMPLEQRDSIVIVSHHFACAKEDVIRATAWDLVVIDEAHRLRNVWKGNKIASAIQRAVSGRPLLLLTATPLQNNLLELYGLVSFLDEHIFGSVEAFRARYMRGALEDREFTDLRERLKPVCQRTLRRQVSEYVRFTDRIPMTQDFTPTDEEQRLYDLVSEYLQRENLCALPNSQRALTTLILRKLLASSTFAIAETLRRIAERLRSGNLDEEIVDDFETFGELDEDWGDAPENKPTPKLAPAAQRAEADELASYSNLAASITENAKGHALISALASGFEKLEELGAPRKAVIFTESRRTQAYLLELLAANGYGGRVLTINGTNTDDKSGAIYREWVTRHRDEEFVTGNKAVDLRAALVEEFRERADILIATEAASEGVNLQFCSLVVNYDLPWNPQRIEQRIGRCHRYGQKHDVVVINFINRDNAADERVFELLSEKFRLFEGVFGSSDEVLGALESGVDFEKRVAEIYQQCRTTAEIDQAFNDLRAELDQDIQARMADTRSKLLENFDEEVRQRLKTELKDSRDHLDHLQRCLWGLTTHELGASATFDDGTYSFVLPAPLPQWPDGPPGIYQLLAPESPQPGAHPYRSEHPLARVLIETVKSKPLPSGTVTFDYTGHADKVGILEAQLGRSGWMLVRRVAVKSVEDEELLQFAVLTDDGEPLHTDFGDKLFRIPGCLVGSPSVAAPLDALAERADALERDLLHVIEDRNTTFFQQEIDKLERWADDLKHGLDVELKDLDIRLKQARREAGAASNLAEKVAGHRRVKDLDSERARKRKQLFEAQDEIDARKEELISGVEARLRQSIERSDLFTLRWRLV